jgi:hypothetical protein
LKHFAAIGLLLLLLIHMLGQAVSVLCLEEFYNTPNSGRMGEERVTLKIPLSIPYGTTWNNDTPEGLIRYEGDYYNIVEQRYENDSLYTVMQANLSAREQFFALADRMQQEFGHEEGKARNPLEKGARIFSGAIKHYMAFSQKVTFFLWEIAERRAPVYDYQVVFTTSELTPATPPPDRG